MSNALIRREPVEMQLSDIEKLGQLFHQSGFFADAKSAAQCMVKILAGRELGLDPFASMSELHVIQGKITMSGNLLAKKVKASDRYDYRVTELTEKVCVIQFSESGQPIGESRFTIEDARKAQVKNLDKFSRNMLFARAISNGVRWFCPDVVGNATAYTDGEIEEAAPAPEAQPATACTDGEIEEAAPAPEAQPEPVPVRPQRMMMCDRETADRLKALWAQAAAKGTLADFVKKQGFDRLNAVTMAKAQQWIRALEQRIAALAENEGPEPVNPGAPTGIAINQQAHIEAAQAAWLSVAEKGIADDDIRAELMMTLNLTEDELDLPKLDSARLLTVVQVCNDWRAALEGRGV